jgi:hypothetical protein
LLDLFELERLSGRGSDLGPGSADALLGRAIDRISVLDATLGEGMKDGAQGFNAKLQFVSSGSLPEIDDAKPRVALGDCVVRQLVVHTFPEEGRGAQFLVDQGLWGAMSETDKAATMLHELLYAIARRDSAQMNSDGVRALVGRAFARPVRVQDASEFLSLVASMRRMEAGVPVQPGDTQSDVVSIDLRPGAPLSFHPSGTLASARLTRRTLVTVGFPGFARSSNVIVDSSVRFDPMGALSAFTNAGEFNVSMDECTVRAAGASNCPANDGDCSVRLGASQTMDSFVPATSGKCRLEGNRSFVYSRGSRLNVKAILSR